jgi:hypothetical protein
LSQGFVSFCCPECFQTIADNRLRNILTGDIIGRFHTRSIQKAIAVSTNMFGCPTSDCAMCVWLEDGEDPWLKACPMCKKGSCLSCRIQPYHEGMTCTQFLQLPLTKKQKLAKVQFLDWIDRTSSKRCPGCKAVVTKEQIENQGTEISECHKMFCRVCGTRFCFRCLEVLTDTLTCHCSGDEHGFLNPITRMFEFHLPEQANTSASTRRG